MVRKKVLMADRVGRERVRLESLAFPVYCGGFRYFERAAEMSYTITLFYAGLSGLILLGLSFQVVALRRRFQVGLGSGDQPELERAIRVHANFCEYTPMALIILLTLELSGALPSAVVHVLGLALVLGRFLHAWGLSQTAGVSRGRFIGTLLTWTMLLVGSLLAVGMALGGWWFTLGG